VSPIVENVIILEYCKTGEHKKVRLKKNERYQNGK